MSDRRNDHWRMLVATMLTTSALSVPVIVTATEPATLPARVDGSERVVPTSTVAVTAPDEEHNHNQVLL